jgi:nitrogen fixation-related uncharacterized protein
VEDQNVTLLEWVAAVAVVVGSAAVLWAVKLFDDLASSERSRPAIVRRRRRPDTPFRKAA